MFENLTNVMKTRSLQIQGAPQSINRIHSKKTTPKQIKIKLMKFEDKNKILRAMRGILQIMYRRTKIKMTEESLLTIMQHKMVGDNNLSLNRLMKSDGKSKHINIKYELPFPLIFFHPKKLLKI